MFNFRLYSTVYACLRNSKTLSFYAKLVFNQIKYFKTIYQAIISI